MLNPKSNTIMAPETSTLNMTVQVRLTKLPTVTLVLERERDVDMLKPLGTEGKQAQTLLSRKLYVSTFMEGWGSSN